MNIVTDNLDRLIDIGVMITISIYLRILLESLGQNWIKTIAHTSTLTLLPILTYVITNVISGNIALSLGMVGALSIVRFRNPVRSPLELSVYFGAITMGISAAVSLKWLLLLVGSVTIVAFVFYIIQFFSVKVINRPFFISSFSEGNALSTLQVVTDAEIHTMNDHLCLVSKTVSNDEIKYIFASSNFSILKEIEENFKASGRIVSLQLSR